MAVGSGGVWKTLNSGTTWSPLFDDENSYSIGCVTIDPNNSATIWVGTGENVEEDTLPMVMEFTNQIMEEKLEKYGFKRTEHVQKSLFILKIQILFE